MIAKNRIPKIYLLFDSGVLSVTWWIQQPTVLKTVAIIRVSGKRTQRLSHLPSCSLSPLNKWGNEWLKAYFLVLSHILFVLITYHSDTCHLSPVKFQTPWRQGRGLMSFLPPFHTQSIQQRVNNCFMGIQGTPILQSYCTKRFLFPFLVTLFWTKHDLKYELTKSM